jgi:hypothetical protein
MVGALLAAGVAFIVSYLVAFLVSGSRTLRLLASLVVAIIVGVTAYGAFRFHVVY